MSKFKRKVTPEMIAKLPVWAQDHIEELARERDRAKLELKEFVDNTTPSPFYTEHIGPEYKKSKVYIQNYALVVEYGGVRARISTDSYETDSRRSNKITINYGPVDRMMGDVILQPRSFQIIDLFMPKEAR